MFVDLLIISAAAAAAFSIGFLALAGRQRPQRVSASSASFLSELTLPPQFRQTPSAPRVVSPPAAEAQSRPA